MSTTNLAPIPRSKAKTAWGLLQDVKKAILAEPKRAYMAYTVTTLLPDDGGPACGTVGCFAGWTVLLHEGLRDNPDDTSYLMKAADILGWDLEYDIVGINKDSVFNAGHGDRCAETLPGTKAHAQAIVTRINRFMKINEKALKRRKIR